MKVICPRCGNIIEISKKDKTCFCSECGNNFSKEQGQEAISRKYKSLQNLAYRLAYDRLDYEGAIQAYKESLQLKSNDFSSIIGIILCKLYGQTFDKLEFKEIINILNSYDISLNNENTFIYLNFIKDVLGQVNVFYEESTSRLMKDGKFINSQYKTYFLDGLKDIHEALLFLKDNLSICYEPEVKEFSESDDTLKNLDLVISKVEADLNKDFEVEKEETTLDDLSVIIVDEKDRNKLTKFYIVSGGIIILAIIILILGSALKNYLIYIALVVPIILGIGAFVYFKKYFNLKK